MTKCEYYEKCNYRFKWLYELFFMCKTLGGGALCRGYNRLDWGAGYDGVIINLYGLSTKRPRQKQREEVEKMKSQIRAWAEKQLRKDYDLIPILILSCILALTDERR